MRPVRFLDVAEFDLVEAFDWYEAQQPGLGRNLTAAVKEAVARLLEDPLSYAEISPGLRRRRVRRFPYDVLFGVDPAGIVVIVGVMHHHRSPNTWAGRWPMP